MALISLKFAYITLRNGEGIRAYGLASYGFIVITPVVMGLFRYGQPLILPSTVTYIAGLVCGTLALRVVLTVLPEWVRLLAADKKRRGDHD